MYGSAFKIHADILFGRALYDVTSCFQLAVLEKWSPSRGAMWKTDFNPVTCAECRERILG